MPKRNEYKPRKGVRKLTDKQRAYVKLRVENPKMSKTKAVMQVYDTDKATNAGALANKLDKNEVVQSALIAHSQLAEQTIVKSIIDYLDSDKQWTLKPLSLTKYLATLIKPPTGGRLLVPFSGSGSEMIGALQAGWEYVEGVELTEEYIPIAEARIKYWLEKLEEESKQVNLI